MRLELVSGKRAGSPYNLLATMLLSAALPMTSPSPAPLFDLVDSRSFESAGMRLDTAWIERMLRAAVGHLHVPVARVGVRVVVDPVMAALHQRHCGLATTTDVLTFAQSGPGEPIEVDIAVCVDEAARRAAEYGHPAPAVERELLLYILHGLLHCAGFDDHDPAEHDRMHTEEDRILTAIGVGPVFRSSPERLQGGQA